MTVQERIARLEKAKQAEQEQRDWLMSVQWTDDGGTAEEAASHHASAIATYERMIDMLKARL